MTEPTGTEPTTGYRPAAPLSETEDKGFVDRFGDNFGRGLRGNWRLMLGARICLLLGLVTLVSAIADMTGKADLINGEPIDNVIGLVIGLGFTALGAISFWAVSRRR